MVSKKGTVAYFSMEMVLDPDIPTYSGGLGVLAGDTLKSAADLEVPMVGVTLVYNNGYFYQMLDYDGNQSEYNIMWDYSSVFEPLPGVVKLDIHDTTMDVRAWLYKVVGHTGHVVPVYLLDTNIESNEPWQRKFTRVLYDATPYQRLVQELILGVAGVRWLKSLGYRDIRTYHMNEGHSAFLTLELLRELGSEDAVRDKCVFTTHTPVRAGHDRFDYDLVEDIFRDRLPENIRCLAGEDKLNMTVLAMNLSRYVNAVSKKHTLITRELFPDKEIHGITNGVHTLTWTHPIMQQLYKRTFPNFKHDPRTLLKAEKIDSNELWTAHQHIKEELMDYEKSHSWMMMDSHLLTIGFARRMTSYKRPTLIFRDLDRLGEICRDRVQIIMAGKTHPQDMAGKDLIRQIFSASKYLWENYRVRVVFLNNYDIDMARLLVAGTDVWLNTPMRYLEASGTSGMKAAHNGVINCSVLDGWWIEGYRMSEGAAGWAIGPGPEEEGAGVNDDDEDAARIYDLLEKEIIPLFYNDRYSWIEKMKSSIKLAAYFNTHRMVREYATKAWRLKERPRWEPVE